MNPDLILAKNKKGQVIRAISTGKLHASLRFHTRPINLVVFQGPYFTRKGELISEEASRLDAFSGYPFQTQLPCDAADATTGTLEVRPPGSSRTTGSSLQFSYAHDR
jgi:hypothetical protein